jgi:dienelactone hydrolase
MKRFCTTAALVVLLGSATVARAAEHDDLLRVYPAGQTPDDPRYVARNIDNPADFTGRFADKAAWEQRAAYLRRQILVANGLWPMPEKTPLNPVIHGKIDRGDYTIEKVYFSSLPGHYVTGNLYRPKNATGKSPAVLCPHGHWNNGRLYWNGDAATKKEMASGAEATEAGARSSLQARCAMLARLGFVVFFYDMVGYADSNKLTHRKGMTDVESVLRLQSQMGLQTWNSIRAVDFVSELPDVDASRLGVTGASGGGTQTFLLAATDDRIAAAFPAVMVGMNMQGGCVCENAPLLRVNTNNVEMCGLFAPKPLAMSAANDWTVDLEHRGLPELRLIYKLYDPKKYSELVNAKHFPFPHNYAQPSREMMYGFFARALKAPNAPVEGPIKEQPFEPVPVKELVVWDEQHPTPADALDNDALRKRMTDLSDKQLAAVLADKEQHRKVVGGALEAALVTSYPGPQGVRVARHSAPMRRGEITIERGVVERSADGAKTPYVAGFPANWNGSVVIWIDPRGKSVVLDEAGNPSGELHTMLDAGTAVVAADLFWTGEFLRDGKPAPAPGAPDYASRVNPPYPAFNLGYNRSVVGNRVHDLLAMVSLARGWAGTKSVRVLATGKAGPWAVLAKGVANDAIDKVAADLGGFDFDQVTVAGDEMLLPGALKYGGIYSFAALADKGQMLIANARKTGQFEVAKKVASIELDEKPRTAGQLAEWIVK